MANSHISNRLHVLFSTKNRMPLIPEDVQPRLWAYLVGVGRNRDIPVFVTGGIDNHVHLLLSLPATLTLDKAVQTLKAVSSKWMGRSGSKRFAWQEGYAAFSVSASNVKRVASYIREQKRHHAKRTFEQELLALLKLLKKHGVDYDPKFVFG